MHVVRKESQRVFSRCLGDGSAGKSTWYTNKNPVQISGTHIKKKKIRTVITVALSTVQAGDCGLKEISGHLPSSKFNEKLCLQGINRKVIARTPDVLWSLYTCMYTPHIYTTNK